MSSLLIVKPVAISALTAAAGVTTLVAQRLLTPDPKEAALGSAIANNGYLGLRLDMGAAVSLDSFFLGFTNSPNSGSSFQMIVYSATDATFTSTTVLGNALPANSALDNPQPHLFLRLGAPVSSRYWAIDFKNISGSTKDMIAGVLAVGLAFAPTWGQEMGPGRPIEDTSTVERLFGGGFGTDLGAIMGGYQWTFGDLSKAEIIQLYAIVRAIGISRDVLIVEDPTIETGWNEAIHWGKLGKLDTYERNSAVNWKWNLSIRDWA